MLTAALFRWTRRINLLLICWLASRPAAFPKGRALARRTFNWTKFCRRRPDERCERATDRTRRPGLPVFAMTGRTINCLACRPVPLAISSPEPWAGTTAACWISTVGFRSVTRRFLTSSRSATANSFRLGCRCSTLACRDCLLNRLIRLTNLACPTTCSMARIILARTINRLPLASLNRFCAPTIPTRRRCPIACVSRSMSRTNAIR